MVVVLLLLLVLVPVLLVLGVVLVLVLVVVLVVVVLLVVVLLVVPTGASLLAPGGTSRWHSTAQLQPNGLVVLRFRGERFGGTEIWGRRWWY